MTYALIPSVTSQTKHKKKKKKFQSKIKNKGLRLEVHLLPTHHFLSPILEIHS